MAASVTTQIGIGDSTTALPTIETGTLTPTGSNKVIYALVGSGAGSPNDPTAVKYASTVGIGGESLTLLDSVRTINTNVKTSVWRLASPSAGSGTIHATYGGNDDERWVIAVAVQDAAGTEGTIAYATANGTTAPSVTPTTTSGELVLDFLSLLRQAGGSWTFAPDASQTTVKELEGNSPATGGANNIGEFEGAGISRETAAGASTVMSWTTSGTADYGIHAFQVNPFAGGGPVANAGFRSLLGVGK